MDNKLKEKIKSFVVEGVSEKRIEAKADPFWQNLNEAGTELWLDTGDMDEAERIWTAEMTALTTNNTLVNKEIQKGIYDEYIAKAKEIVKSLPEKQMITEIAFILNARHGLRLAHKFGGLVSVELHTDTAHDIGAAVDYGIRYSEISPSQFIVKVPYTAEGLLSARILRQKGVKVNFTLEFSARQNVLVAAVAKPNYMNVFLGRIGAYISDNGLGDGSGSGERAVLASQKWVRELTKNDVEPGKLIAASLRNFSQLEDLAGVDVFTMPVKVAVEGKANLKGSFKSRITEVYPADLNREAARFSPEKCWEVNEKELELAKSLSLNVPGNGEEVVERAHKAGCGDMFPQLSESDERHISEDGKIPKHERWAERIEKGEIAMDTLLNLAGLANFANDQEQLDERIKKIIS
jgi:transaldolase